MLKSVQDFMIPEQGAVPLCEIDGCIHSAQHEFANISTFTHSTDKYPVVHITRDHLHSSKLMEEGRDLLMPVATSFPKQLIQIFWEQGFHEAVETAADYDQIVISKVASLLLSVISKIDNLKLLLNPGFTKNLDQLYENYLQVRKWHNSTIRAFSWHKDIPKLAVATLDDVVRVFGSENGLTPILKCKQQKNVTCLAWRPMSNSDLAVGCENGVIIWNVDPNSMVTRLSLNHAIVLHRIEHKPVLDLAWSSKGDILATVAGLDSKILLWDPEMDRTSSLKRAGTNGYHLAKWAPSGDKLLTASNSCVFRVWNTANWKADRWSVLSGRLQAGCWSPNGKYMLFSTSEEPIIYLLSFINSELMLSNDVNASPNEAIPVFDATKMEIDGQQVGGLIRCMEWDYRGHHVAVLFEDTNFIAVFTTSAESSFSLNPGFIINGKEMEIPTGVGFQPNFDQGCCLTISWTSGRLQYFPIIYSDDLVPGAQFGKYSAVESMPHYTVSSGILSFFAS